MDFTGTSGDDTLTGTSGDDLFKVYQGGNDTVSGLTGSDVFNFAGTLTAADTIDGGGGQDTVQIKGDYSAGLTLGATTMVNVETLQLGAGFNYDIILNDATVAAGAVFTMNASALDATNHATLVGDMESDGLLHFHGGAGDDTITMGARMVPDDHFDGGDGYDTLHFQGAFGIVFKSISIHNIEAIDIDSGASNITFNSGNVLAGQSIVVDASGTGAGDKQTINAHNLPGNVTFNGGAGLAKVTGGSGDDTFNMGAHFTSGDRLDGGLGNDTLVINGDYNLTLSGATIAGIDEVILAGGHSYNITSAHNLITNQTMAINASSLGAGDSLTLDFSSETAGSVIIDGGAGPATLIGGQQGDAFDFAVTSQGGLVASDSIDGQGGYDRLYFDGDYTGAHALVLTDSTVMNIEEFDFEAGHSYNITLSAHTVGFDDTLTIDASLLGAGDTLTLDGSPLTGSHDLQFIGGAGNDTLISKAGNNTFDLSKGGEDTATSTAFGSYNYFSMGAAFDAGDRLTGSSAVSQEYVALNGDYTGANAVTLSNNTLTGIGQMNFEHGHSYDITWADGDLPAGQIFTVAGHLLQAGDHLRFDGSAETDGQFEFQSGNGSDDFTGGSQADTFDFTDIALSAATHDIIHGFDASSDSIECNAAGLAGAGAAVNGGQVNTATIDADFATVLTASRLAANHYVLFTPGHGDLAGHLFLVIDGNGVAGYQKGWDLVIELQNSVNLNFTPNTIHF